MTSATVALAQQDATTPAVLFPQLIFQCRALPVLECAGVMPDHLRCLRNVLEAELIHKGLRWKRRL